MEIVGPHTIQANPTVFGRSHELWVVMLIFGNEEKIATGWQYFAHALYEFGENVSRTII